MSSKIGIIIRREFLERVSKKSFIITTILMPILMLGLMLAPAAIMMFAGGESKTVIVVDQSGEIAPYLVGDEETTYLAVNEPLDSALRNSEVSAVLFIPRGIMSGRQSLQLYTNGTSSLSLENEITRQVNSLIEQSRLRQYNIENLSAILEQVKSDVKIQTLRNDREEEEQSTILSYALGMGLTFMLYMFLLLYGQMVMTSIIEEKNNRVLEIVVSSVKPTHLMLGKIFGICLVAVTQIIIWAILITSMSAFLLPSLLPADVAGEVSAMNSGQLDIAQASTDLDLLQAIAIMGNAGYILQLFVLLLLFLVGGFLLYAAIYAAIGSSVDNIQDAGQLQSFVVFPIIFGIIFGMTAVNNPGSDLAFWTSMIPFTSPMVMMARIPFGIPAWEIWVSAALLYVSFFVMVWIAAKIYRVGIFMYGKKPSLKELVRWARYK